MNKVYFTVGPSQTYPTFEHHMQTALKEQIGSISHRGSLFKSIYKNVDQKLKTLMGIPPGFRVFFVGSSLESMERIIQNTVLKSSFHLISGSFGKRWHKTAKELGKKTFAWETPEGEGFDFGSLKIPNSCELVCITQNDTSTGVWLPIQEIQNLKSLYPDMLFALDLVSSAPIPKIDYSKIDMVFFSVQKGFGLPAGLGVLIVSPESVKKAEVIQERGVSTGSYHNFLTLDKAYLDFQTPETPNVLNIFLLDKILDDMLKKGIEKLRKETDEKAKLIYNFFDSHNKYDPFVKNKPFRSLTSLVIDVKGESGRLRAKLSKKGIEVGSGYGAFKEDHVRIANFPQHSLEDVNKLIREF